MILRRNIHDIVVDDKGVYGIRGTLYLGDTELKTIERLYRHSFNTFELFPYAIKLPAGRYKLRVMHSAKLGECVELYNDFIEQSRLFRLHKCNWPHELDGCIGVGLGYLVGGVSNSKKAMQLLCDKLKNEGGSEHELLICNE